MSGSAGAARGCGSPARDPHTLHESGGHIQCARPLIAREIPSATHPPPAGNPAHLPSEPVNESPTASALTHALSQPPPPSGWSDVDLHVHTTASDGQFTAAEIVALARARGV